MGEKLSVVEALAAVAEDVREVRKGDRNTHQNFSFRGIDSVLNAVGPAFRKHGVVCVPETEQVDLDTVQTTTGKPASRALVRVRYRFYGPAGDSLEAVVTGESWDSGDKGVAKAYSVAYRTCLLQTLTIPTDDPDPDEHVYERAPQRQAPPKDRGPMADAEMMDELAAQFAAMSDEDATAYGEWRKAEGIPSIKQGFTVAEAEKVVGWLAKRAAGRPFTEEGGE